MKITDSTKMGSVCVGDLSGGDVFRYYNAIYIKAEFGEDMNCMSLCTGKLHNLNSDLEVTEIPHAVLTV
jgi:hypothetical protein